MTIDICLQVLTGACVNPVYGDIRHPSTKAVATSAEAVVRGG